MKEYTTVEAQVEYGLDAISEERTLEVPLRDLLYVYKTLGEFVRFFHQPMHYPKLEHVNQFLGNVDEGAAHLLFECYYRKLYDVWPEDVKEMFNDSQLEHPIKPYYYEPTDEA